ncbi:hypothetical protein GCM10009867_05080 [Pedococcus aerophilus]|uniref:Uncharacterized protein n=1 Tax=Pedococcus aerophilus TaxID=436356 RepID=A0ABP6GWG9_9MICO|nr:MULTISPECIES: DUF6153 family protein [unclassified Phycicoccus]KQU64162.1 hypothetical protein ASC58_19840 [Phycicoccus sp. Root101]
MSIQDRSGTTARRALWFGGLLILLAGIVGMHGLNSHNGGMAHDMEVVFHEPVDASMPTAPLPGAHEAMVAAAHDVGAVGATVVDATTGWDMDMTAMCMAVLTMALLVLLRMLSGAPALPLYQRVAAPARAPGPHGRDPDPPSLIVLSIRRC